MWLIEQLTKIDFEILAVSYIISELFLLGLQIVMQENQRLKELVASQNDNPAGSEVSDIPEEAEQQEETEERTKVFLDGMDGLTKTERLIFDLHVSGKTTKEIMEEMNIKENTLKFHNKNIYSKLGVSSRKQLKEIYSQIKSENSSD